ncbi:MAG TPA: hypothetical protein VEA44_15115 [Caulobacter sp.]|nr:hypothetical protein [Caulobacter sp.]
MRTRFLAPVAALIALWAAPAAAQQIAGAGCAPPARCEGEACLTSGALAELGNAVDPKTGRRFFLDFPCDLKPGESVVFILNIHGAGSIGNWQRHYFPAADYKDRYRLVVATPTAATSGQIGPGGPSIRMWQAAADDEHLRNIADLVIDGLGPKRIKAFWLAGHSQGGLTSSRIVCSDYFKDRVDGWLSLSGGRIGRAPIVAAFGPPKPDGSPPDPLPRNIPLGAAAPTTCDFSHIFTTGAHEITGLPDTSPWAEKYGCGPRVRRPDIVDTRPGHVWDYARASYPVWGTRARPGTAEVFVYPGCRDGRLVADVVRLDKGHTEGLEPRVTEALVQLMVAAPGGKVGRL